MTESIKFDRVFRGKVPSFLCSDVTSADCDVVFRADAPHCGNPDHHLEPIRGTPNSIPRPVRQKARLVVNEDYDLVEDDETERDLDPDTFDPEDVWVSRDVQSVFTWHHNTSPEDAIENVRLVIRLAVHDVSGNYYLHRNGLHEFRWRGSYVAVTPNLACAVRYTTKHFERTPLDILNGVPSRSTRPERSRSGSRRFIASEHGPPVPYPSLINEIRPDTVTLVPAALSMFASRAGLDDGTDAESTARETLCLALRTGEWKPSDRDIGAGILTDGPLGYVFSGRGPALVAVFKT